MLMFNKKEILIKKLIEENCFWSHEKPSADLINDDILIEKVLIYLDLEEINMLFSIYTSDKIKKTWINRIVSQEPYYHQLNEFIRWFYFNDERINLKNG